MGGKLYYLLHDFVLSEKLLILLTHFLHLLKFFILFPDNAVIGGVILGTTCGLPNNSQRWKHTTAKLLAAGGFCTAGTGAQRNAWSPPIPRCPECHLYSNAPKQPRPHLQECLPRSFLFSSLISLIHIRMLIKKPTQRVSCFFEVYRCFCPRFSTQIRQFICYTNKPD